MSITLNDNLSVQAPKPADARYGPYADTATANAATANAGNRYIGLTVGIGTTNTTEYWYNGGIADSNLVVKSTQIQSDWNATSGLGAILNKPTLFSGSYTDLTNKPTLFSGSYTDLTNKPALTLASSLTTTGAFALTLTTTATTAVTLPTTGILSTLAGTETLTNKRIGPRVYTPVSPATTIASPLTPDISAYDQYCAISQTTDLTINAPSGTPLNGDKLLFRITADSSARTVTLTTGSSGAFRAVGTTLPITVAATKTTYIGCVYNSIGTGTIASPSPRWDVIATGTEV